MAFVDARLDYHTRFQYADECIPTQSATELATSIAKVPELGIPDRAYDSFPELRVGSRFGDITADDVQLGSGHNGNGMHQIEQTVIRKIIGVVSGFS
jgi:hypothetical protein